MTLRRRRTPTAAIAPEALRAALRPDTALVTLALANHELGNVYDVAALARVAHEAGALFHTDAVQAAGKLDVDVGALGVDALTLSAHKLHGPKGVGRDLPAARACRSRRSTAGGHQERERRAGTENVAGIVGFGVAARLAARRAASRRRRASRGLRDRLEARLLAIPGRAPARRSRAAAAGDAQRRLRGRAGAVRRRRRWISRASASRRARRARRARWRRRRCCWRSGCRGGGGRARSASGSGATNDEAEIERVAELLRGDRRAGEVRAARHAARRTITSASAGAGAGRGRDVGRRRFVDGGGAAGRARATTSSARRCGSTTRAAPRPASAGAAAGRATSRTRARPRRSSASRTT